MRAIVLMLCLTALVSTGFGQARDSVWLLAPAFANSASPNQTSGIIGKRAATILGLQVWQTLRLPMVAGRRGAASPRAGGVIWDIYSTAPNNFGEAEDLAGDERRAVMLILWGRAFSYGGGIVVESFLSILDKGTQLPLPENAWILSFKQGTRQITFTADVPDRRYEFGPFVLAPDLVPELSNPSGLILYEKPGNRPTGRFLGNSFRAVQQSGDYALVNTAHGSSGWVYLPNLSREPSEVVNFCGGLIRFFRKDWSGAMELLEPVVKENINGTAPTSVKVAAYLYMAIAANRMGDQVKAMSSAEKAYELDPYSQTTVKFLCLGHLARFAQLRAQGGNDDEARQMLKATKEILSKNRMLFAEHDEWVSQVMQFVTNATR